MAKVGGTYLIADQSNFEDASQEIEFGLYETKIELKAAAVYTKLVMGN